MEYLFSYGALFVLLAIFVLLILYTITLTAETLMLITGFVKTSVFEEALSTGGLSVLDAVTKIISIFISLYLLFIIYSAVSAVFTYKAYETAAHGYSFEKPDLTDVLFKTIRWNFYRIIHVYSPVFVVCAVIEALFIINLLFFNEVLFLAGLSIRFMTFLITFISISLAIGYIFAIGLSVWNLVTTMFGTECAVTEPHLENTTIKKRSKRLSLVKRSNFVLCVLYLVFVLMIIVQLNGVLLFPAVLKGNTPTIIGVIIIDIGFYIGLGYLKSAFYVESLLYQYDRITFNDKNHLNEIICEL